MWEGKFHANPLGKFQNRKHFIGEDTSIGIGRDIIRQGMSRHLAACGSHLKLFIIYVLFNDALNTFYLRLYGVGHMVKDHSDSERGNPLPPNGLLFPINSKGSFICTIPQTG